MNTKKIFIDGQSGTTGLLIRQLLEERKDVEILSVPYEKRHDPETRKAAMRQADLTFLCLPDQAAREAAQLARDAGTKVIDASTAHRTQWTYGFPELQPGQTEKIAASQFVANPGCHATGALAILKPLTASGWLDKNSWVQIYSLTGYTGGGKKMIHEYEQEKTPAMESPKPYSLDKLHKHIPEIMKWTGLEKTPAFVPIVDDYDRGMLVLCAFDRPEDKEKVTALYKDWYAGTDVTISNDVSGLYANLARNTDRLELFVTANDGALMVACRLDNLGKGACLAAIRNMETMLQLERKTYA